MTISLYMVIAILFSHWIADFIMQDDFTAINKSKSHRVCFAHSLMYTGSFGVMFGLSAIFYSFGKIDSELWFMFCLITLVSHFVIDSITSRINLYLWKNEKRHLFFVCIGFDQFLHIAILMITLAMIVK